jgi:hypothetical protein
MKLLLSFTVFFSAFAFADYGGSAMYPETNCPAKPYTLHIGGVPQTPTYDKVNTLYQAAIKASQRYPSAIVSTTGGEITCSTTWRTWQTSASSSSRSSSRSSSAALSSSRPSVAANCPATNIQPFIDSSTGWLNVSATTVSPGTRVSLGPHPYDIQTGWRWSGCGITSTEREVGLVALSSCVATVTLTNSCGTVSSQTFQITVTSSASSVSAQSSSASSLFTLIWEAPTKRENNEDLALSEIGGFAIKYESGQVVTLPPSARSYKVSSDKVQIAAFDTNGLYSNYTQPQR